MKGHHELIEMRKAGMHPKWVFVNDFICKTDWHEWGEHATISTIGDSIAELDFRGVMGLHVSVSGYDLRRVQGIAAQCLRDGAAVVAAGCGLWSRILKKSELETA